MSNGSESTEPGSSSADWGSFYVELGETATSDDAKHLISDTTRSTDELLTQARDLIKTFQESDEFQNVPLWFLKFNGCLDKVFTAMLDTASECGGDAGLRYVASAICTCQVGYQKSDLKTTLQQMKTLGLTWFAHLLWLFKVSSSYSRLPRAAVASNIAQQAIPTRRGTELDLSDAPSSNRTRIMREQVLRRQNYQCPVTGVGQRDLCGRAGHQRIPTTTLCAPGDLYTQYYDERTKNGSWTK
ncbi:uncharacterized protein EV420DRAFT_1721402 [Desarmillaria tabescens]|uniref:Uncharacterized protein n=1 Tax=Armillaria tabescens TaxID=1929756 RepID=A0AA39MRY9_ARMTA|nr:uncharacterized protein EV420DRAFT_1721402 [Desarmillaria tabescens]KAK0444901.1 hypothetical protein EV420DRAFT_1721402 [Desarmillaria tabescens]